jgi:hypothetical protein
LREAEGHLRRLPRRVRLTRACRTLTTNGRDTDVLLAGPGLSF